MCVLEKHQGETSQSPVWDRQSELIMQLGHSAPAQCWTWCCAQNNTQTLLYLFVHITDSFKLRMFKISYTIWLKIFFLIQVIYCFHFRTNVVCLLYFRLTKWSLSTIKYIALLLLSLCPDKIVKCIYGVNIKSRKCSLNAAPVPKLHCSTAKANKTVGFKDYS